MLLVSVLAIVLQIVGVAVTVAGCLKVGVHVADPSSLYMMALNQRATTTRPQCKNEGQVSTWHASHPHTMGYKNGQTCMHELPVVSAAPEDDTLN
jgi:hypothetical protein